MDILHQGGFTYRPCSLRVLSYHTLSLDLDQSLERTLEVISSSRLQTMFHELLQKVPDLLSLRNPAYGLLLEKSKAMCSLKALTSPEEKELISL